MKKLFLASICAACLNIFPATAAEESSDTPDFDISDTDLFSDVSGANTKKTQTAKTLSAFISSRIPASSSKNIENAEKVFCYTVEYATADFSGYTIDDLAITGSCGELSAEGRALIKDAVLGNSSSFSTAVDNCSISPKLLLRYIHGIDSTDILFSVPCHSLTFFHGKDISTINAAPGKNILEQIVSTYSSLSEKFLSPALLGQVVPNGQVITQEQKEIVRKLKTTDSPKKWQSESAKTNENSQSSAAQPVKKGWNKLRQ